VEAMDNVICFVTLKIPPARLNNKARRMPRKRKTRETIVNSCQKEHDEEEDRK
jgi:hypothetical protein